MCWAGFIDRIMDRFITKLKEQLEVDERIFSAGAFRGAVVTAIVLLTLAALATLAGRWRKK